MRHPRSRGAARPLVAAAVTSLVSATLVGPAAWAGPPEGERRHVVQQGDTLSGIASRYGVRFASLVDANEIRDPDRLRPGTSLRIPPGGFPAVSAAPRTLWPAHERADALLARAERKLAAARFEEALDLTEQARALLDPISRTRRAKPRLAGLEVAAATVYVAMSRRDDAIACFRRALEARPDLVLDPDATSPKVLRLFVEAQEEVRKTAF